MCCRPTQPFSRGASFLQQLFHACPALAARLFWGAGAAPVGFETYRVMISVALEGTELSYPVNDAAAHGRPFVFAIRVARHIFAVDMADTMFWKPVVALG